MTWCVCVFVLIKMVEKASEIREEIKFSQGDFEAFVRVRRSGVDIIMYCVRRDIHSHVFQFIKKLWDLHVPAFKGVLVNFINLWRTSDYSLPVKNVIKFSVSHIFYEFDLEYRREACYIHPIYTNFQYS